MYRCLLLRYTLSLLKIVELLDIYFSMIRILLPFLSFECD